MAKNELSEYFTQHEYGRGNRIVFLYGGWRFGAVVYRPLIRKLTRKGYKCVLFVPRPALIAVGTPYSKIVSASQAVTLQVGAIIDAQKTLGIPAEFISFGISFGTIFATEAAKRYPDIKKLILVAPFGDFAEHVKLWPQHRYFSKVLTSQPTSQKESGEMLNHVGLTKNSSALSGTRVMLCFSDKDRIIHSEVAVHLADLLVENKVNITTTMESGGHLMGIIKVLGIKKTYAQFFDL